MSNQPDHGFIVEALETPIGHSQRLYQVGSPMYQARQKIFERYTYFRRNVLEWSYSECSIRARAEWLEEYLSQFQEDSDS